MLPRIAVFFVKPSQYLELRKRFEGRAKLIFVSADKAPRNFSRSVVDGVLFTRVCDHGAYAKCKQEYERQGGISTWECAIEALLLKGENTERKLSV